MSAQEKLKDVTNCSICLEVLKSPKILPCIHTFCLQCLETYSNEKKPGKAVACPICRKEFQVPNGGYGNLPNNVFIEKLLEIKKISNHSLHQTHCDVCRTDHDDSETEETAIKFATTYCADCRQNLCQQCTRCHKKQTISKSHQLLQLGKTISPEEVAKSCVTYCQQHRSERLKIHCFDCKTGICMMCFVGKHKTHNCADIEEVTDTYRSTIKEDAEKMGACIANNVKLIQEMRLEKEKFVSHISETELQISKRSEELKKLIENHTKSISEELRNLKEKRVTEIDREIDEIEKHIEIMGGFKQYAVEISEKGTASDTASSADRLHNRSRELEQLNVIKSGSLDISFLKSSFETAFSRDKVNLLGKIEYNDNSLKVNQIVKRELSAKITFQRSAKGPIAIFEISADGKSVVLENTGRKEEDLSEWKIKRQIDDKDGFDIPLPAALVLKASDKIKVWAKGSKPSDAGPNDIEIGIDSFGSGGNITTRLCNPAGEDRASHIQKTSYA